MTSHNKPRGELGSLRAGEGSAEYQKAPIPAKKDEIERWALESALAIAHARDLSLYDLVSPPEQNPENDFDFTLSAKGGVEYLDLMEVGLMELTRGFEHAATSYAIDDMVESTVRKIQNKSTGYGQPTRPVHLLLYNTDFRFHLTEDVLEILASALQRQGHVFASIVYVSPHGGSSGTVASLHPRPETNPVPDTSSSHVVFGDIRRPTLEADGSVTIPVTLPAAGSAVVRSPRPSLIESRVWVAPPLCGCELEIEAAWVEPGDKDATGRLISDRHPVAGTVRQVQIVGVCETHRHFCKGPSLDETYGGIMPGYLSRPQTTEAETLYVALSRFGGQVWQPDTCGCRIYQLTDRTTPTAEPISMRHPRKTYLCAAHSHDSTNHAEATENNLRKSHTVNQLMASYGIPLAQIRSEWTASRTLLMNVRGLSAAQRRDAQTWCDERFGPDRVGISVNIADVRL